jgi:glyoxylase-like metal-dependent hydrolase (beta-lactamase superfamily II)
MDAVEPLARMLADDGLKPVAVVLTHGHLDHTFSVLPVCDGYDIPAYLHPADSGMLADPARWHGPALAPLITGVRLPDPSDVRPLDDGAVLSLAGVELTVRHAPGHTQGSVVFSLDLGSEFDGAPGLLAGDVLFAGSVGRVDLPGGSWEAMLVSLRDVVLPLTTRRWCCPATARRRRSAASGPPTPTWRRPPPAPSGTVACERLTAPRAPSTSCRRTPARFLAVRDTLTAPLRRAGYGYVETPVFEETAVFSRGVGESTDVVTKEMYTFDDRGGRSLTLRPELTAGLMRAFIEHRLHTGALPVKLWTVGSAFRYERPQAGRYRHFTQVDMEALGVDDPALDAEVVALGRAGLPRPRADRLRAAADLAGRRDLPPAVPRAAGGVPGEAGPRRGDPAGARRSTRCGCSTTSGPRCRRSWTTPR